MFLERRPLALLLLSGTLCAAGQTATDALDRKFQAAVTHYNSGQYAEAEQELESLAKTLPDNFDVQELLGLVYSAEGHEDKAAAPFERAVRLKSNSATARTNLAVNLLHRGKPSLAEAEFKKAVELEPGDFGANHDLGEFYVRASRIAAAVPYLEKAQRIDPSSYDNGYDLSLAYTTIGRWGDARKLITELLKRKDTAELHALLAGLEEKDGQFVAAANEYERAAHLDPSESNLFDWGSELLLHRTLDPAIEVFRRATERYPNSARLAIGLGIAFYAHGDYDAAVKALLRGTDLDPSDSRAYSFLSWAYDSSPNQADEVTQRFRRFAQLQPHNGRALYYYAMSLWKGKRAQDPSLDLGQIESLLKSSVELDHALLEPHQQLGNLYSEERKYAEAINEYEQTLKLNPDIPDAHYRLGQAYVRVGEKDRAQEQFQVYQRMRAQQLAERDRQQAEIRQFVYSKKEGAPGGEPTGNSPPPAGATPNPKPTEGGSLAAPIDYYDETQLKPSAVGGAVDPGGYSAAGQARTSSQLLEGVAGLKKNSGANDGAPRMGPNEQTIFDSGSELLLHGVNDSAIEVFIDGVERYPRSAMLQIGLGVALYSRGRYDEAVKALCAASDLTPSDPRPYYFLDRMYNITAANMNEVTKRLERYAQLQPQNAVAHFYYAMCLWKGQHGHMEQINSPQIESLLKEAIALDPNFPDAHLEIGNLYAQEQKYPEAIREYQQAIHLLPDLADAHYRLAQAYTRTGEQALAKAELDLHERLRKQQLAQSEKQRAEIKQFVSSAKQTPKP